MLSVATVIDDSKEGARQKLTNFWKKAVDDINSKLEQVSDGE
jgi:hypothetical protein